MASTLSTWCRDPAASPATFCDRAEALGADGLALDARLPGDWLSAFVEILPRRGSPLVVRAIEAPCPRPRAPRPPRLACADRDERRAAIEATRETLRLASHLESRVVVLRLGGFDFDLGWKALVRAFSRREIDEDRLEAVLSRRLKLAATALDWARFGLEPLLDQAEASGIVLALSNRARPFEIPDGPEIGVLLEEFRGAPLAPWFDAAAAHAREAIGLAPPGEWLAGYGRRACGAWLSDAAGLLGGLPWGRGEVDRTAVLTALAAGALTVVHCGPGATDEELAWALSSASAGEAGPPESGPTGS